MSFRKVCLVLSGVAILWSGVTAAEQPAAVQVPEAGRRQPPTEGRLWNIDSQPFTYRIGRRTGMIWSEPFTLAPDEMRVFVAGVNDEYLEYEGLRGYDSRAHVAIEYPQFDGVVRVNLPGRTFRGTLVPNWFHFRDANGLSRWIQAPTMEDAVRMRDSMLSQPPMSAEQIETWKRTHRANWVYFDKESRSLSEPLPPPPAATFPTAANSPSR